MKTKTEYIIDYGHCKEIIFACPCCGHKDSRVLTNEMIEGRSSILVSCSKVTLYHDHYPILYRSNGVESECFAAANKLAKTMAEADDTEYNEFELELGELTPKDEMKVSRQEIFDENSL